MKFFMFIKKIEVILENIKKRVQQMNNEKMNQMIVKGQKYIGLILDERNDYYTIGYRETTDLKKLRKWMKLKFLFIQQ